jgi:RNA polymerase sigma-70 factor (ECF subfamily)
MLEDELLILRIKCGDKGALRRLYEKHKSRLLTVAGSLVNDSSTAEDVVHDVFVTFAAGIHKYRLYGSLVNYLTTCVVNRVRDRIRKKKFEMVEVDRFDLLSSDSDGPEKSVIFDEQSQLLANALTQVPFEQREVVVLHLQGGMKFREIASSQGVSLSTAQARYRYGLEKLRSILNPEVVQ